MLKPTRWFIGALLLVGMLTACGHHEKARKADKAVVTKPIDRVLQEHTDRWLTTPGVVGTAIGEKDGKPCIKVLAAQMTERIQREIPDSVDGYAVVVDVIGEIRALDKHSGRPK